MKRAVAMMLLGVSIMVGSVAVATGEEGEFTFQSAATVGNGWALNTKGRTERFPVYVIWSSGCTAGGVTYETAASADFAGTWRMLAVIPFSAANSVDLIQNLASVGVVRARISTEIVGGTVTVVAKGIR